MGPGGWWSWPLVAAVAGVIPLATWAGWSPFGANPITLAGTVSLALMLALWWDNLAPRIAWNTGGFAARSVSGMHRGAWSDARSVFLVTVGRRGHRIVIVTPSGRYDVVPDRLPWPPRDPARTLLTLEDLRATRKWPDDTDPPRLQPPMTQFVLLLGLWAAGMVAALALV